MLQILHLILLKISQNFTERLFILKRRSKKEDDDDEEEEVEEKVE